MRKVSKVCEVDMYVTANVSNYLAKVQFCDGKGKVHERVLEREHEGTVNGNYLTAMTVAFRILLKPCMVTVHCGSDHITACIQNGWVNEWEKREWKNAKGNKVKNAEQWEQFRKVAAPHSVRVIYEKGAEDEN